MSATVIDGKAIAQQVRAEVREQIDAWVAGGGQRPGLATVLVGDDPASAVYVANKQKACGEVGIEGFAHDLPADGTQDEVVALLAQLNADPRVSGILLAAADPRPHRRLPPDDADRRRQGRRRADPGVGRSAGQGPAGAAAVHAVRGDRAAQAP